MLSIGKPRASSGGASAGDYYLSLVNENYYTDGGEPPGRWWGDAAADLQLAGAVDADSLDATLRGFDTAGKGLVRGAGENHVPCWDFTFSAPKSVSVLWAMSDQSGQQTIQQAQQQAVEKTLAFIEDELATTRRGAGGTENERVAGLLVATFEHGSSRENDPQLHTHCLIHNVVKRQDGGYGTLDSRPLYRWGKALGALYRAELAQQLQQRLGVGIERDGQAFAIQGVPPDLASEFSKRRGQIVEQLQAVGVADAKVAEKMTLLTRPHKNLVPRETLFAQWQAVGEAYGFGREQAAQLGSQPNVPTDEPDPAEKAYPQLPAALLDTLSERGATFTQQTLFQAAAVAAQGHAGADEIRALVEATMLDPETVDVGVDKKGDQRFSTQTMLRDTEAMLALAVQQSRQTNWLVSDRHLRRALDGQTPTDEQQQAIRQLTQAAGAVQPLVGMAGTGKTAYVLAIARQAWEASGYQVLGAAYTGKARRELAEQGGFDSRTLHSLLGRLDSGQLRLGPKDVVVLDEANMVGTRQLRRLLDYSEQAGAKVVLVGDPGQLQPIDAGAGFRLLTEHLLTPTLTDVQRQHAPWQRTAVKDFAAGRALEALRAYAEHDRVFVYETRVGARESLVDDWWQTRSRVPHDTLLMVTGTHLDAQALNAGARTLMQTHGQLGDRVVLNTVGANRKTDDREFAVGDTVLFGRNDTRYGVENGATGTITGFHQPAGQVVSMDVCLSDQRNVCIDLGQYRSLDHGYALTTHKAEGMTVDHSFILSGGAMTDRELTYVQASRHRQSATLYADQESLDAMLVDAQPTVKMIDYANALAIKNSVPLPENYDREFLVCRDFLNSYAEREIDTDVADLTPLALQMAHSRAEDTPFDYRPEWGPAR